MQVERKVRRLLLTMGLLAALPLLAPILQAQYLGAAPVHELAPRPGLPADAAAVMALISAPHPALTLLPGDELASSIF